jgi:uncharacterized protein YggE
MKKENNAIVITLIIASTIIILGLLVMFVFVPMFSTTSNTISVQGTSTIQATPDLVAVYFDIQTNGTTSSEANDADNVIYNNLTSALLAMGFNSSQIGTASLSIYPNIVYDNFGNATNEGYIASQTVKLELPANDTNRLTSAIDAGANAGAGISSIDFELSPALQDQYKSQALTLASEDAKTKADAVASGLSKSVGKLVSVSVDEFDYAPWVVYNGAESSSGGAVAGPMVSSAAAQTAIMNIAPTTQDVSASVTVVYRII